MTPTLRALASGLLSLAATLPLAAQHPEWRYWGADAASTRYSPLDQIDASNFGNLQVAWIWRADNFSPSAGRFLRATPIYVDGTLYSVAGTRRTAVAIDPATGETLWTFREPQTGRWEDSMRKDYGKGVAYAEVDGRGTIYMVTPAFFLHALDPVTGRHVASFGEGGTVDLLGDLGPWEHHPTEGLPPEIGYITNSSPPIVVNGVVVVGNSHEQGYYQTRKENVPGNIIAYDAATGAHLWTFNVIPREGEFGNDTWENDAWKWTGNVSSWAPLSADPELGLVYVVTDPPTVDYYGGFHPGDNLFATGILALDVKTGERRWHFPDRAPRRLELRQPHRAQPGRHHRRRARYQGACADHQAGLGLRLRPRDRRARLADRGAARAEALDTVANYRLGPLFNPPAVADSTGGVSIHCPGANGGANIPGGAVVDPETGILYLASTRGCSAPALMPGTERDENSNVDWVTYGPGGVRGPLRLPLVKPPYSSITAIDLNTGDHLWQIPNGTTPDDIRNHPALEGVEIGNTGARAHATKLVTKTLLMYDLTAWEAEHGELADGTALLVRTGWSSRWNDRAAYLGTDLTGPEAVPELHFPGIAPEAAQWLVDNRGVAAVGIDTPSIDYGQSSDYRSHVILYERNIVGFENLTNLERLPATGAGIVALPMKIEGGSGGPLRVVGWVGG